MKTLYVGCRVRIVRAEPLPTLLGCYGVIFARNPCDRHGCIWHVHVFGHFAVWARSESIEPIPLDHDFASETRRASIPQASA
jgi:hypothetical protein